jgi:amino acid adenylation domain-containing protein
MAAEYSEAKQKLLEKYLRGELGVRPETRQIPRRKPGERIPLSHAQEQVWLHSQLAPDLPLYNEPVTIHYSGVLNVKALEQSFNEILRRHEAWRTAFKVVDGEPVQEVQENLSISLPVIDLRGFPREQRDEAARCIATADARVPLDLGRVPLFRAKLIRLDDNEHRLYLTLSHIIFDGVAIYRVFLPELSTLYKAFSAGDPNPLPELRIQYPDYACWERSTVTRESLAKEIEYWREQLGGTLPEVYLPTDHSNTHPRTFRGSMCPFKLRRPLTKSLREFGRKEGVSTFHVLLASFAALLQRYSGEKRIPIGTVTAGRKRPETEHLLGYFLNTLVVPADVSGNPSFRELVRRARSWSLAALDHDRVPFEYLVRELNIQRKPSRNPLFQALFSLDPPLPDVDPGWRLTQMDVDIGTTRYDLYLELNERTDHLLARFHYSTDLFERETIARMVIHWKTLIRGGIANPEQRLSELPLVSSRENRFLRTWNDTVGTYPKSCIHQLFELRAQSVPGTTAIVSHGQRLSYRELNERANQLAWVLLKRGVAPDGPVGLCVDRGPSMVIALLGILKAGGAYVPLDPKLPDERLAFLLADSKPVALLVDQSSHRPSFGADTIVLDPEWKFVENESRVNPSTSVRPENLAYVMYTSGSTGRPKGVEGTHKASMNRFAWMWRTYPFASGEVCCQKTNLTFVDSIWEIFGPLLAGIPSVIVPQEAVLDPELLLRVLARERVTRIVLVPSQLRALLDHAPNLQQRVPELKLWSCSGEVLPGNLARRFRAAFPGAKMLNIYGASEVAADATCHEVAERDSTSVPIGKPISNTQVYLVDEGLNVVPIGIRGEIYIGGDGLARGYRNRPELTAERFVDNLLAPGQGSRLYRTGDLGRWRGDGEIEYLGRVDTQIKLRGVRIELGEIESVLASHPAVREAVVAIGGEAEQQKLAAYLVMNDKVTAPEAGELRRYLRTKLPEHMVPASYWQIEKVPLLPSGKVNRAALAGCGATALVDSHDWVGPRTETEVQLAEIWRELLKVERVRVDESFFELGGHSLLVLQMTARIRRTMEVELPVRTVFESPTIAGLAQEVQKARAAGLRPHTPILPGRQHPTSDPDQEALLTQLNRLSAEEATSIVKAILEGR